jgi:predicted AAA+ superfamily ATPase
MITNVCFNSTDPTVGLALNRDSATQKCYFADTGLLVTQAFMDNDYTDNDLYKAVLLDKLGINEGMLLENIAAQALRASGHKLYFYSRNDHVNRENHIEIDFLIKRQKKICPIEVKSSDYTAHASLTKFIKKFEGRIGRPYILYTKDILVKDGIVHLPVYMAAFL